MGIFYNYLEESTFLDTTPTDTFGNRNRALVKAFNFLKAF